MYRSGGINYCVCTQPLIWHRRRRHEPTATSKHDERRIFRRHFCAFDYPSHDDRRRAHDIDSTDYDSQNRRDNNRYDHDTPHSHAGYNQIWHPSQSVGTNGGRLESVRSVRYLSDDFKNLSSPGNPSRS